MLKTIPDNHDVGFDACPHCGSFHIHHESVRGVRYARCQKCSASGGYVFDYEEYHPIKVPFTHQTVVLRWNRRINTTPLEYTHAYRSRIPGEDLEE